MKHNNIDIGAFTETLPKNCSDEDFSKNDVNLTDFTCLSNFDGRGVCLYVNKRFEVLERLNDVEALFSPSVCLSGVWRLASYSLAVLPSNQ